MPTYFDPDTGQPIEQGPVYYDPDTGEPIPAAAVPRGVTEPASSGEASAALLGTRAVPGVIRSTARIAASHPAAVQKTIGALFTTAAAGTGAALGGVPGAVVGASIRGVTPAQTVIREMAGRLAGEAPDVAANAARALAIQNYAKETVGVRVKPSDIIPRRGGSPALDAFAKSQGRDIIKRFDPYGNVVSGPEAVPQTFAKKATPSVLTRTAQTVGRVLGPISAGTGITDFAQTVEPNRRDIGVMGIGPSQLDPSADETQRISERNRREMEARLAAQADQRGQLIAKIAAILGLQ